MKILAFLAAMTGLALLGLPALAAPMLCSGEQKLCIANCGPAAAGPSMCVTACAQRKAACLRTGCWDNGRQRYCGLTRQ
jgi:hypothetical protein